MSHLSSERIERQSFAKLSFSQKSVIRKNGSDEAAGFCRFGKFLFYPTFIYKPLYERVCIKEIHKCLEIIVSGTFRNPGPFWDDPSVVNYEKRAPEVTIGTSHEKRLVQ